LIPALRDILDEYRGERIIGRLFDVDLQKLGVSTIRPIADALGLEWFGFHAFRRGIATNLYSLGASDKTVQRVRRHAKADVTREKYIKSVPKDVVATMSRMNDAYAALPMPGPIVN
jgi:integrase